MCRACAGHVQAAKILAHTFIHKSLLALANPICACAQDDSQLAEMASAMKLILLLYGLYSLANGEKGAPF